MDPAASHTNWAAVLRRNIILTTPKESNEIIIRLYIVIVSGLLALSSNSNKVLWDAVLNLYQFNKQQASVICPL